MKLKYLGRCETDSSEGAVKIAEKISEAGLVVHLKSNGQSFTIFEEAEEEKE